MPTKKDGGFTSAALWLPVRGLVVAPPPIVAITIATVAIVVMIAIVPVVIVRIVVALVVAPVSANVRMIAAVPIVAAAAVVVDADGGAARPDINAEIVAGLLQRPAARLFPWLVYFSALGLGFMFVEISLIQKFILFLGHPVYSVSLVIFALLVFAGLGSRLSVFIDSTTARGLKFVLLGVACLLFLSTLYLPQVLSSLQGKSVFFRQLVSIPLIAPFGFLMGMPFPLGIRLIGAQRPFLVSWAWCANGCASVLGSILPVVIALAWGFQVVFFLAGLSYVLGLLAIWKSS